MAHEWGADSNHPHYFLGQQLRWTSNHPSFKNLCNPSPALPSRPRRAMRAPRRSGCHRLVEVRRFTIDIVQKLVKSILRGVLIPAWLRLRVLFPLFLFY